MAASTAYDEDFYVWTQEQARLLRDLPRAAPLPNALDLAHIAEEIQDMGKSELARVQSNLIQMLVHLIKLATLGLDSTPAGHWIDEITTFRVNASAHFSQGMRQLIEMNALWTKARKRARDGLIHYGDQTPTLMKDCPFELDELIGDDVDLKQLLARLVPVSG